MPKNNKITIEKRLTTLEVLLEDTRKDVSEIKDQVFNALPHEIADIKSKLFYGFIIGIATIVIAQIVLKIF